MRKNREITYIAKLVCSFAFCTGIALAGPVFAIDTTSIPNTAAVTLFNDGSTTTFDIHGAVQLDVFNPGFVGAVALFDTGQPFGNNLEFASNFGAELGSVVFDFTSPAFSNGGLDLQLTGLGSAITTVTDPALSQLLTSLQYNFGFLTSFQTDNGTVSVFGLTGVASSAVPEPASMVLFGTGGVFLLFLKRRRRPVA
jgi:hypothetical protein